MEFRKWDTNDIFELERLEKNIFSDPWSIYAIYEAINCQVFHGYVLQNEANEIIGYYGFYAISPEAHIANIAVIEGERGKGYSKLLMDHLIIKAKELGCVDFTLEVRPSNVKALSLYEKYGFKEEGRRKKYYGNGEDAIIMWRREI